MCVRSCDKSFLGVQAVISRRCAGEAVRGEIVAATIGALRDAGIRAARSMLANLALSGSTARAIRAQQTT
jgi:hypothetical protein